MVIELPEITTPSAALLLSDERVEAAALDFRPNPPVAKYWTLRLLKQALLCAVRPDARANLRLPGTEFSSLKRMTRVILSFGELAILNPRKGLAEEES